MRRMDLDTGKAYFPGDGGRIGETSDDLFDLLDSQRTWLAEFAPGI